MEGSHSMNKPKIGLLPLYLELYDQALPQIRPRMDAFRENIIHALEGKGLEMAAADVCRIKTEFDHAVSWFELEQADIIVTLHLAYSPSLESAEALASTKLPVVVLDTTPAYDFSPSQEAEEILYNHGIHGVQDLCNLLIRNKKSFKIEAGHWKESDVLDRVAASARAAKMASTIKNARVGRIGEPFKGMGDFAVEPSMLKASIGIETILYDIKKGQAWLNKISESEVISEMTKDKERFVMEGIQPDVHRRTTAAGLMVRKWIEENDLTAFTVNFLAVDKASGIPCMPFLEAGKAMSRGIGYAGEGDVLTAALVGALASVYPETTFTEMFCPDWKNNSIFLSHMGEMNLDLSAEKLRLIEKDFPYTDADNPAAAYGRLKAGKAVFVNLAPAADGQFVLIAAPGEMLEVDGEDKMKDSIHGWFQPASPVADFLSDYSRAGGTHHAALVYGDAADVILRFGEQMGWRTLVIR